MGPNTDQCEVCEVCRDVHQSSVGCKKMGVAKYTQHLPPANNPV